MKQCMIMLSIVAIALNSCGQNSTGSKPGKRIGGRCEGCEAIYENPIPFDKLTNTDTLPDFYEQGPKMVVSGTVYHIDGKTPAANVVIYVYHTDQTGNYTPGKDAKGWEKRHGYIRGWMKTDKDGLYQFYTLKPAPYPGQKNPAHIHITVKEPGMNEYYLDEYLFADDPLLTRKPEDGDKDHGGNGTMSVMKGNDGLLHGKRNLILGLNVPDYPRLR